MPSPLSILFVADVDPVLVIGGAERVLSEYAAGMAERGHKVTVLTRQESPDRPAEEQCRGFRVVRHPSGQGPQLERFWSIWRQARRAAEHLLQTERFDVCNIHQPLAGAAVLPVLRQHHVPCVYTFLSPWGHEYATRRGKTHGGMWRALNRRVRERLEGDVLRSCAHVCALSSFSVSQLVDIHHLRSDSIEIIPGGVDVGRFHPVADRAALRRDLGLADGPLLFTVRNLEPRMGLENLVDAMRTVVAARPDVHLVIGGKGSLREALTAQVEQAGVGAHVRLVGFISEADLPRYYAASDAFVLPTRELEGFGLVAVEALACGTPVLGTPVGSIPEILSRVDPSLLFESASTDHIAAGLLAWLSAPASDWTQRCRALAESAYSWPAVANQMEATLVRVAAHPNK